MLCKKWYKAEDGTLRVRRFHRCDTCGEICENDDYLGDDEDTMCIPCWNKLKKMEQPAAGTTD